MSTSLVTRGYVGGGAGVAPTPTNGEVLSIAPGDPARWDPIVARVSIDSGDMMIMMFSGQNWFLIYNGVTEEWAPFFAERSGVVDDGGEKIVTVLPNGGWWSANFQLMFFCGTEMSYTP